jgi:hypothetical protein
MVLINKAINEITVKLVYYGPGLCGKTTNLEKIYGNPKLENKGKMISMATETDRTLFFDFMPLELGTIGGQKVRVQLYTVPGQVFYDATRKLVLRGADGVVFVADSQSTMRESNLDSLENLRTNLRINRIDPDKVALVFQLNKRDLDNVDSVDDMRAYLHSGDAPLVEASAKNGTGVTQTLRAAVARMLENLKNNVDTTLYDEPELGRPDMTARSGVTPMSAGTPKLSMKTAPAAAPAAPPPPVFSPVEPEPMASPFDAVAVAEPEPEPEVDEDPFGAMHGEPAVVAEEHESPFNAADNPFSATEHPFGAPAAAEVSEEVHDSGAERAEVERTEIEELLASARAVTASLQDALERARHHEAQLAERLQRL